jgi:hypothetical protein
LQNTSMELIARFSDNTQIYWTGGSIITAMAIKNPKLALLDDSLVGFWNFEKTKNWKLFDYSKNLTDWICYSAWKNINCKTTQDWTMTFNGEDEYVELDNSFNYYWARGNTIYVSWQINEKSSSWNYDGFIGNYCWNPWIYWLALKALNNNIELRDYSVEWSDPVWNNYTSNKKFSFTSTIDFISAEYKLYVDNDLIDTRTTTTVSPPIESNCPFRFWHIYGSMWSPAYLNGEIDTIRIYNKPLSLELIKLLATTQD